MKKKKNRKKSVRKEEEKKLEKRKMSTDEYEVKYHIHVYVNEQEAFCTE